MDVGAAVEAAVEAAVGTGVTEAGASGCLLPSTMVVHGATVTISQWSKSSASPQIPYSASVLRTRRRRIASSLSRGSRRRACSAGMEVEVEVLEDGGGGGGTW